MGSMAPGFSERRRADLDSLGRVLHVHPQEQPRLSVPVVLPRNEQGPAVPCPPWMCIPSTVPQLANPLASTSSLANAHPVASNVGRTQPGASRTTTVQSQPSLTSNTQSPASRQESGGYAVDHQLLSRLNEYADFLVRFNNSTVNGVERHCQLLEARLDERLTRLEADERSRGSRLEVQLDLLSRSIQGAVMEGVKTAFAEEAKQEKDATLVKNVSNALSPVLNSHFNSTNRYLKTNADLLRTLQNSITSLESRLEKLENHLRSSSATSTTSSSPGDSSTFALPIVAERLDRKLEEIGCMIDRLAPLVEKARDEAHSDKEELSSGILATRADLTVTLHDEFCLIKKAVGVEMSTSEHPEAENAASEPRSLMERLEVLENDVQEAVECFKDAEAMRDDSHSTSELMRILEFVTSRKADSEPKTKILRNAAVMTNDCSATAKEKALLAQEDECVVDVETSQNLPKASAFRDPSLTPLETNDLSDLPQDESSFGNTSATTLVDAPLSSADDALIGNLNPVTSWSVPSPEQLPSPSSVFPESWWASPAPTSVTGPAFGGENGETEAGCSSTSELQLINVPALPDPNGSMVHTPSSVDVSDSHSPGTTLKRKASTGDAEDDVEDDRSPSPIADTVNVADLKGPTVALDLDEPLSPLTAMETPTQSTRSPSPLTPLGSEDEEDSSDEDNDVRRSDREEDSIPLSLLPASADSPNKKTIPREETRAQPKKDVSQALTRSCPYNCGRSYLHMESFKRHLGRGCARAPKSSLNTEISSSKSTKRRKLTGTLPSPAESSGNKRRGRPRKDVKHSIAHPLDVLENCEWPAKSLVNIIFDHQLIQCDRCDSTYHYRCVGVVKGDERLIPDAPFICPPCAFVNNPQASVKNGDSCCGRPDCDWPGEASDELEDYFVVEKLLGRSVADLKGSKRVHLWLVKWLGYPIKECDWLGEDSLPNANKLIGQFYNSAAREGLKVVDDESIYLLKEVREKLYLALKYKWKWVL